MVERLKSKLVGLGIVLLLGWMSCCPQTCRGAVIWADDFNDGNYDGWTICDNDALEAIWPGYGFIGSQWSATNNYLQLDTEWGIITYPSTIAYGTWSFDFKLNETLLGGGDIYIISTDRIHTALTAGDWNSPEKTFIMISFDQVTPNELEIGLHKRYDGNATTMDSEWVPAAGWHHIDVTRTTEGLISVYHNGALIMQGVDTDIVTSELFALWWGEAGGQMIDNIVVRDDVYQPLPWGLLVIGVVVAVVVIVVVIVFLRRRRAAQ